jgi:hypothetical protein
MQTPDTPMIMTAKAFRIIILAGLGIGIAISLTLV